MYSELFLDVVTKGTRKKVFIHPLSLQSPFKHSCGPLGLWIGRVLALKSILSYPLRGKVTIYLSSK